MAIFTFTPEFGATRESQPAVRQVKFGDGYEQRLAYGLNYNLKTWSLEFKNRTDSEANAIEAFLDTAAGVSSFDWTTPDGVAGLKWVCRSWSRRLDLNNLNTVTAKFEQVAEP